MNKTWKMFFYQNYFFLVSQFKTLHTALVTGAHHF